MSDNKALDQKLLEDIIIGALGRSDDEGTNATATSRGPGPVTAGLPRPLIVAWSSRQEISRTLTEAAAAVGGTVIFAAPSSSTPEIEETVFDIAVVDVSERSQGSRHLRASNAEVAILVVSSVDQTEAAIAALADGADDFILIS